MNQYRKTLQLLLITLLSCTYLTLFAQNPKPTDMQNYTKDWEAIHALESDGKTKSALEASEKLYEKVDKDSKNPFRSAQLIKVLLYTNKYRALLEEDGLVKAIYRFEETAKAAKDPEQAILYSMLAEMYDQYLNHHLYKFRDRTEVLDYDLKDIRTWDIPKITKKCYELHQLAISSEASKKVPLTNFQAITYYASNVEGIQPTVYDFLMHRAIEFFQSEKYYLTKPAFKFYVDQEEALGDAKTFINYKFTAEDSLSTQFQTLVCYQQLLDFHLNDKDARAFLHAELKRLDYARSKSILPNKEELYYQQLENLSKKYASSEGVTEIWHKMAVYHRQKGNSYEPSPLQINRWELKTAVEICDKAIEKFPKSYGTSHCKNLKYDILAKSMSLNLEKVVPQNEAILASIQYKNLKKIYLKVVELNDVQYSKYKDKYGEEKVQFLNRLSAVKKWSVDLIDEGDYQNHRLEFEVEGLESGRYVLVASEREDFKYDKNGQAHSLFHVSDLAYFSRSEKGIQQYYVTNRNTGAPLEGVSVSFYKNKYNSLFRRYEWRKVATKKTDKNGMVSSPVPDDYNSHNYALKLEYKGDRLYLDDSYYNYKSRPDNDVYYNTHFFLDRAIYRPGQTVYFKGIVIKTTDEAPKKPEIVPNYSTTVVFYDANYQEVAKVDVKTNEYGSYQGSFTAPLGGLTGQMRLSDTQTDSDKYFRVEEYKRPKFEVKFKPIAGSFKLGEEVEVTGLAEAYAGNKIDGAKVSFRVIRTVSFPYWAWWRWGWYNPYSREQQEIKFGEMETDENGEFIIKFNAIPDKSIPEERQPQFSYTVYADVVDITGETHSSQVAVQVGYVALKASLTIAENVERTKFKKLKINTYNLNGEFEAAAGSIKIEQLITPEVAYKKRYWSKADYFILKEADFKAKFPQYPYQDEDAVHQWEIKKEMLTNAFDTEKSKEMELSLSDWPQGKYKLTLNTKDKFGTPIEVVKYFTVYDEKADETALNQALFLANSNFYNLEPNEKVELDFGSYNKAAWLLLEVEEDRQIVRREWIQPNGRQSLEILIEEKHRGNFHYHLSSVQNNRFYGNGGTFYVPFSNKELKIEYSTFRDKLYPGQEEEWRIKITGLKKDKVAAELLAGMYDASLDAFASNYWYLDLYPTSYRALGLESYRNFTNVGSSLYQDEWFEQHYAYGRSYPRLNWFGFSFYEYAYAEGRIATTGSRGGKGGKRRKSKKLAAPSFGAMEKEEAKMDLEEESSLNRFADEAPGEPASEVMADSLEAPKMKPEETDKDGGKDEDFDEVKVRTNLNETVFFFPQLMTDENGDVILKFTMNEALTRWKFMTLAHTKDLKTMSEYREIVTQKDLMILPNAPRFFRQGDELYFTAKLSNLTEESMKGQATLQLFDAISMEKIDAAFANPGPQAFEAEGGRSAALSWKIKVPADWTNAVTYRVIAKAGDFSDGEENSLPVLSSRMLVTETQPLPIRGGQTKTFNFKRMEEVSKSSTMKHHKYTLEFTQNPAWYAVQALPYLMEYPYECTEQIFSRYYANSLASEVANSHPKVKRVFEQWKNIDTDALKSNLSKNEELKYALLEETPWVLDAQSEEQQKKNIGLLFDLNRMAMEQDRDRDKIAERQLSNGGFAWFPGGRDNWYITQYLVEGMGHLDQLGVKEIKADPKMERMIKKAVHYCDDRLADMYRDLLKTAKRVAKEDKTMTEEEYLALDHLNSMAIHYMYARSFFLDVKVNNNTTEKAVAYYEGQAKEYWGKKTMYMKGLLALGLDRKGTDKETPQKIVTDLDENSLNNEEMGMYWKYPSGYYWYQAPIETHALMIEVFDEVAKNEQAVDDLKVWLLKNKQTTNWKTTKATAAAVYALLRRGDNWLLDDQEIIIHLGGEKLDQSKIKKEAGTGYFKTTWDANEIKNEMAEIKVQNPNNVVAWGAVYWQYFEELDKITHFEDTPLKLDKKLFKQINTDRGPKLIPIDGEGVKLEPGDLLKVRIELRVDRDMEYVHMKDQRASGFEPTNVLSNYKYQGGLGYYESTKDAATHFFFDYLSKGTYVFEYPLRVNHKGDFSNGITTIQCMYAPEFTSHSEGIRVTVE
jgi:uncharacterized protein YfaS (alpha-2-macroglobulin family)